MFNFYIDLDGHNVVSLTPVELPRAGKNSKPPQYKQKLQQTEDLRKIWVSTVKQFEDFRQKKRRETLFSTF